MKGKNKLKEHMETVKPGEAVDTTTFNQFELLNAWRKAKILKKATQSNFCLWQCSTTYNKTGWWHIGNTQQGSSTPRDLLTRLGSFRLPLVCINGSQFAEQRFHLYEDIKKMVYEWFMSEGEDFYRHVFHKLPERWGKCMEWRVPFYQIQHVFFLFSNPHFKFVQLVILHLCVFCVEFID